MSACLDTVPSFCLDTHDDICLEWESRVFESITAAQDMLDFLEAQGFAGLEFDTFGTGFEVRWRSVRTPVHPALQ